MNYGIIIYVRSPERVFADIKFKEDQTNEDLFGNRP